MKTPLILVLIACTSSIIFTQQNFYYQCGMNGSSMVTRSYAQSGPLFKPIKTLPVTDINACFRILLVFAEFKNDINFEPASQYWPPAQPPRYIDSLVSPVKLFRGYPDHIISDYFNQTLRDSFDVTGDTYYLTLPHTYEYYKNTFGNNDSGRNEANRDVLRMLDTSLNVDWNRYDLWQWNGTGFVQTPDNYIDMVYIQYRRGKPDFFNLSSGGHADLKVDYNTLWQNKFLRQGTQYLSSGMYGINGAQESKIVVLDFFVHEYCHYILGPDHRPYSRVAGGDGSLYDAGFERSFSPQDRILLGIAYADTADWTDKVYRLRDFATTGHILIIPTILTNDYFIVSNRRRISKYDRSMGGDTVRGEFFGNAGEYDKGIYIYHVFDGNDRSSLVDLECADGLWDWTVDTPALSTPDWSNEQLLPLFKKAAVGRNDDEPGVEYVNRLRLLSRDGMSVVSQNWDGYGYQKKWFSTGKRHDYLGDPGMERTYTNKTDYWCSRECLGDRYDAWTPGYNNIFSPYSSPNTKSRWENIGGDQTGIFVYYTAQDEDIAEIKVLRTGYGGFNENQILGLTPPSKPLLFRIKVVNCNGEFGYPMLTWDNNLEPDMLRAGNYKRYKIYRAESNGEDTVPDNYRFIGVYDDRTPGDTANFIDNNPSNGIRIYCNLNTVSGSNSYYRYMITAEDKTNMESVKSDFISIRGHINPPDGILSEPNGIIPVSFNLEQNYPNPFNPVTVIKFDIPLSSYVTMRIYNVLGEEVAVPLNNIYAGAGSYRFKFNGSALASGIYFYSLTAGTFRGIKKMVLIK